MDINNNENSQVWTDPITGEVHQSGNPHVSLRKSTAADPNVQVTSFRQPEPSVEEIYPRQSSSVVEVYPQQQDQPMQQMPGVQPAARRVQVQMYDPLPTQYGGASQYVERHQVGGVIPNNTITKFCEHCGSVIAREAVICPSCGCQVAAFQQVQQAVIINNNNLNHGTPKDKLVALILCLLLGGFGAHRFYEGKIGTAILFLMTGGLFGIGWLVDLIRIACAPKIYYV